jgi:hypothetical protein
VQAALGQGHGIVTGCATGADAAAILATLGTPARLSVFVAFAADGKGSWSGSNTNAVNNAAFCGATMHYTPAALVGLPLVARLMRRSQKAVDIASACVFFAPGPGSLKVAGYAVGRGLQVYAVQAAAPGAPRGCAGKWVTSSFLGLPCWQWSPAQKGLF